MLELIKEAKTEAEKRKTYCFCPIIRNHLDEGTFIYFFNCGAGWLRQQWENVFKKPVNVQIIKSVLNGDHFY